MARSWLGRGNSFFSRAKRIPELRLERQKVLLKLSLTLGIDCQHFLTKFVTTAYKTQGYKHPIKAGLVNIPSAEAKGLKAAPSEKDPSLGNRFSKDRRKSSALLLLVSYGKSHLLEIKLNLIKKTSFVNHERLDVLER